jgi:hypothetical protein
MNQMYSGLWNKYRPAILKLMRDSGAGPQSYKLSAHEFRGLNPKAKGGFAFAMTVSKGKALTNIRSSEVAKDLLSVLQLSGKALEFMNESQYELSMDKQFVLRINRKEEEVVSEETVPV